MFLFSFVLWTPNKQKDSNEFESTECHYTLNDIRDLDLLINDPLFLSHSM